MSDYIIDNDERFARISYIRDSLYINGPDIFRIRNNNGVIDLFQLYLYNIIGGDADMELYRDNNNSGTLDSGDSRIALSRNGGNTPEVIEYLDADGRDMFVKILNYSGNVTDYSLGFASLRPNYIQPYYEITPNSVSNGTNTLYGSKVLAWEFRKSSSIGNINLSLSTNYAPGRMRAQVFKDTNNNGVFDNQDTVIVERDNTQSAFMTITNADVGPNQSFFVVATHQLPQNSGFTVNFSASYSLTNSDFNKDGKTDIVLQNLSGGWSGAWTMNGTTVSGWAGLPSANGATIAALGDLNNDGKSDIIYQNLAQGWSGFRAQDGTTTLSWTGLPFTSGATIVDIGDLNNDGKNDIVLQSLTGGWSGVWTMNGATVTGWAGLPSTSGATIV